MNVTRTGHSPSPLAAVAATALPDPTLVPLALDSPDLFGNLRLKKRARSI
jgi:hypothetical protein